MLEIDRYLRMAEANFHLAESQLKETEHKLRKLLEKFEGCVAPMENVSGAELPLWEQVEQIVSNSQPIAAEKLGMVSS